MDLEINIIYTLLSNIAIENIPSKRLKHFSPNLENNSIMISVSLFVFVLILYFF